MTTELTKLREALRRVKYEAVSLADAQVIALEALTTSRPAQAGADEVFLPRRLAATHKLTQLGYRYDHMQGQWLPTQPAAQATPDVPETDFGNMATQQAQATPEPGFDDCPSSPTGKHSESWFGNGDCDHCKTGAQNAPMISTHTQQAAGEPVGEVVYQLQSGDGKWIDQTRASYDYNVKHGNTVRVLYTRPAQGVPDGFALVPYPPEGHGYVLVRVDTGIKDGWCFCTPKNHPEDVARGLTDSEYDDSAQFFGNVLAAAQAKGGER